MEKNEIISAFKRKVSIWAFVFMAFSLLTIPQVYATGTVTWGSSGSPVTNYNIEDGSVGGIPITFEVTDTDHTADPSLNTISVTVTTNTDPVGTTFTLTETGPGTGTFTNTNMIFMEGNAAFQTTDTAVITIEDDCVPNDGNGNCNSAAVETLIGGSTGAFAISETDSVTLVPIHFTETGPNTGIFVGKLQFTTVPGGSTSDPYPAINKLEVAPGDVITIIDSVSGSLTNGIILPMDNDIRAVLGNGGGTATVTYTPVSGPTVSTSPPLSIDAHPPGAPGRGGGGLVAPGLVVDVIAASSTSSGNGCRGDCKAPTLGVDDTYRRLVDAGFSYNNHPVDVELFYTHYPLVTANVGRENSAVLKIYDNSGVQNIEHVELAFGLGKGQILDESKASISIDMGEDGEKTVSSLDPENVLQDIRVETTTNRCSPFISAECLIVTIYHTFRAPLDFDIVATEVWDHNRNTRQNYYNDGVEVVGESLNPPPEHTGIYKGHQIRITETDKNTAIDSDGNVWRFDKEWIMDYVPPERVDVESLFHGYGRNDVGFVKYRENQILIAKSKYNEIVKKVIQENPFEFREISIGKYVSRFEDENLKNRQIESVKIAEETFKKLYFWEFQ